MIDYSSFSQFSLRSTLAQHYWRAVPLDTIRSILAGVEIDLLGHRESAADWIDARWQTPSYPWSFMAYLAAIDRTWDVDDFEGKYEVQIAKSFCLLQNILHAREKMAFEQLAREAA